MHCSNCSSLFEMIQVLNGNVASILSGYELILNVINNHETEISEIKARESAPGKFQSKIVKNNVVVDKTDEEHLISSSLTSIAANVDILSLSNLEIEDNLEHLEHSFTEPVMESPKPSITPKPDLSESVNVDQFSDISEISYKVDNFIDADNISTITDSTSEVNSSKYDNTSTVSKTYVQGTSSSGTFTSSSEKYDDIIRSCNFEHHPYEALDHQIFNLFEPSRLNDSTVFTHFLNNRNAAYYGKYPYCYGKILHKARDFSENPYLDKVLNYVQIAYPSIQFNSATIHRYNSGEHFIPHHSDDEEEIIDGSLILTISLGETRSFEFREKGDSEWTDTISLNHGDCLVMTKNSQRYFTHGIPRETSKGMRISITLRLIKPHKISVIQNSEVSTQTLQVDQPCAAPVTTTLSDFVSNTASMVQTQDGYQPSCHEEQIQTPQRIPIMHQPSDQASRREYDNGSPETPMTQKRCEVDSLYISSSMFRHLDPARLSSARQKAQVLFYPGADAKQMANRAMRDPNYNALDKHKVKKIFVMVGTNNVDQIFNGSLTQSKVENDISDLLYMLWARFGNAKIHVINLLPRQNPEKNRIVHHINEYIQNLCQVHGITFVCTEFKDNPCFSYPNGAQNQELFSAGYDNVHLNVKGYSVLARYLKYLAHVF